MRRPGPVVGAAAVSLAVLASACTASPGEVVDAPRGAVTPTPTAAPRPSTEATRAPDDGPSAAATAAGEDVDVWVEEPPLGPVPDAPADPPTSEEAVVGYLRAAHTVEAADAAIRHRRHHPWLHPSAPGRTGGLWTTDPPPEGVTRRVEVVDLVLEATADHGAAWAVTYRLWDGDELHAERTRHVTTRQVDDAWFVVAEAVDLQPVPH